MHVFIVVKNNWKKHFIDEIEAVFTTEKLAKLHISKLETIEDDPFVVYTYVKRYLHSK